MYNVSCSGGEASVFDCSHSETNNGVPSCSQSEDAGVICQGQTWHLQFITIPLNSYKQECFFTIADLTVESSNCTDYEISLVEGVTANEGKIKVCLNHFWGTVCDRYFDTTDANTICRQLGYQPHGMSTTQL